MNKKLLTLILTLFVINCCGYSQNVDIGILLALGPSFPLGNFSDVNKTGITTGITFGAFEDVKKGIGLSYCFSFIYNNFAYKDNNKSNIYKGKYDGNLKLIGLDSKIGLGNFSYDRLLNFEIYLSESNHFAFYPDKKDTLNNVIQEGGTHFNPYVGIGGAIYVNITQKFSLFVDTRFNLLIGTSKETRGGSYFPFLFGTRFKIK